MLNILIVDDELAICLLLAEMLKEYGYDIVTETDGCQVLPLLQTRSFDAVIVDLMMPNINGIELVQQIKKPFPDLPIFASKNPSNMRKPAVWLIRTV
jgi:CheY-like chemotaxis protein